MLIKVFKSKIHRAKVTGADLHYEGSIAIDIDLLAASHIRRYEAVWVWNINNGERLMTYALEAPKGSKTICLNGSAARLCQPGDLVIISAFADMTPEDADEFLPTVVCVDENNCIKTITHSSGKPDA